MMVAKKLIAGHISPMVAQMMDVSNKFAEIDFLA